MKQFLTAFSLILSLALVLVWQVFFSAAMNYYLVCAVVLVLSMMPFFIAYEIRRVSARELTLTATLIALAVVSRAAFYLLPQVKPIAAVVIVSAVCLGAQRGYIIGAFSAFISNFLFGQGMWTPFQMVALGLVGFLSGWLFQKLPPTRFRLAGIGFLLSCVLYGLIVDLSTILAMYGSHLTWQSVLSVYGAGAPFSAVFGVTTAVFLFFFGEPFIKKINRICTKYDLLSPQEQNKIDNNNE